MNSLFISDVGSFSLSAHCVLLMEAQHLLLRHIIPVYWTCHSHRKAINTLLIHDGHYVHPEHVSDSVLVTWLHTVCAQSSLTCCMSSLRCVAAELYCSPEQVERQGGSPLMSVRCSGVCLLLAFERKAGQRRRLAVWSTIRESFMP